MAFVDHDLHIHSRVSPCAGPEGDTQLPENILKYAYTISTSAIIYQKSPANIDRINIANAKNIKKRLN